MQTKLYESRDKWTQIGCLHTILCLWVPLKHEEAAIFHRKMSEFRMFSVILGVHKHGKITDDSFKIHLSGNSYEVYVILNRRTSSTPQSSALKTTKFSLPEVKESGTPRLRPCKALDRRVLDVRGARVTQQGHNLGAPDRVVPCPPTLIIPYEYTHLL